MTRPDSGSPDQSANQDDAIWLDLVAQLEGKSPGGSSTAEGDSVPSDHGDADDGNPAKEGARPDATDPTPDRPADVPGRSATFRDFDPLGLGRYPQDSQAAGPRDYDVEDDGGDFVPDEPPSLAGPDPLTMLAWLGAVGAPVALLLSVMFWRSAPLLAILGMVAAFLLSVVYLIMKLPQEKDENDDGARV
jgi:hypothetical protein